MNEAIGIGWELGGLSLKTRVVFFFIGVWWLGFHDIEHKREGRVE